MPSQYKYIRICGRYFCSQQNPIKLYWYLCFNNKSLKLIPIFKKYKAWRIIRQLMEHRLGIRVKETSMQLPFFGNLCLRVHRGHRLFNYPKKRVIKVFDSDVPAEKKTSEINAVQQASEFSFTPHLFHWDIKQGWYEEELINGYLGYGPTKSDTTAFIDLYHKKIAPCIEQIILSKPVIYTTVGSRISDCLDTLQDTITSELELDRSKVYQIEKFVKSIIEQLSLKKETRVGLVPTHGDFSFKNILSTENGLRVLDWESLNNRTILCDLYNCFFTEIYYERVSTQLIDEIKDAISSLQLHLTNKSPEIAGILSGPIDTYRKLYYLERICTLAERRINNQLLDVILRSITVFQSYERIVSSSINQNQ